MPRLDALIAKALGLSRKRATALVRARTVTDEAGAALPDPALRLAPSGLPRTVHVKGAPVVLRTRFDLVLHKPVGCVTALSDARHPTAYALLSDAPMFRELRAVGRLDLDTSGLLAWTTDGDTLHRLTHPRYGLPRVYHVGLSRPFAPPSEDLELDDGHRPRIAELVTLPEAELHPALRRSPEAIVHASITLTTGRFHEVRRIFAALGSEVIDLCRVAFGPLELARDLPAGAWRAADLAAIVHGRHPAPP